MSEIDEYDYELPRHLIAQEPLQNRSDSRLLIVDRKSDSLEHSHVRDLPDMLHEADCLVLNDTRVIPARLVGFRNRTGGRWEGLFLETEPHGLLRVMSKTRGRLTPGETVTLLSADGRPDISLRMAASQPDGTWVVRPESDEELLSLLERVGRVPLPPYIRKGEMIESDRENYQTIYARTPGAIAAPTAGLHLTKKLLEELQSRGVTISTVTLHVGTGTFRPIETETLAEHPMHSEWANLPEKTVDQIRVCKARGGRVLAVGTTTMRVLETAALGGELAPFVGKTELFIRPDFVFRAADALLTNFHLPRTTLLVLARTFGGDDLIKRAYEEAIREEYRLYSYGDAMLIL